MRLAPIAALSVVVAAAFLSYRENSATGSLRGGLLPDAAKIIENRPSDEDLAAVGALLFVDSSLSKDSALACSSCHKPDSAFTSGEATTRGIGLDSPIRNAPPVQDLDRLRTFGWTGKFLSVADVTLDGLSVSGDMGVSLTRAVAQLSEGSSQAVVALTGNAPTPKIVVEALVAYQRSLESGLSPFDCFMATGAMRHLSEPEHRGWRLFVSAKTGCAGCHHPVVPDPPSLGFALFTDGNVHNIGIGFDSLGAETLGRFEETGHEGDRGAYRTPSLRNVTRTAPYMHDGSLQTLADVIAFYARGGNPNANLDPSIVRRELTRDERSDLVAFLGALDEGRLPNSVMIGGALRPRPKPRESPITVREWCEAAGETKQ